MAHELQQKPEQSQAKNNDAKPDMQNQDIFQMRWEANLIMQKRQEEEILQGKPNPFATQKQSVEEEEPAQPKMDTTVAQRQEEEEMLQAKMSPISQHKPEQSQAKNSDTKPSKQYQDIFQMRWDANLAMQKQQEEEILQGKYNPSVTQKQSEEEEELAQPKMDTTIAQRQEEEEMLQAKMASTQFLVSEEEEDKKMPMQKKSAPENDNAPTLGGTTTKMPEDVQSKMENSFGSDFSGVNIHANDPSASQMGALAYTQGSDISFANGQYNPNTQGGQELLGHELTHVVQQSQGRVSPTKQAKGVSINDSPELENEADGLGKQAAQGKSVDVSGKGSGLQKKENENATTQDPEMKAEQVECAIAGNNALNLSPLSISYLQIGICVPPTGVFDKETVEAIGKISIENRVSPLQTSYSDALRREMILDDFNNSISEKDKKTLTKTKDKLGSLKEGKEKKRTKLESKKDEIEDRYIKDYDQEHLIRTEGMKSSSEYDRMINEEKSEFKASDGELDLSTFNTIFNYMALDGAHSQALQLALDYGNVQFENKTISTVFDPTIRMSYRVKVPFSQLEANSESDKQSISNAPNSLRKLYFGKSAFSSYTSLLTAINASKAVTITVNNNLNSAANNAVELTETEIKKAKTNNNGILKSNKSVFIVQAITGAPDTGIFDDATIRAISEYQSTNNITRTDGIIDRDTISAFLNRLAQTDNQNASLALMSDFYSLGQIIKDKDITLDYSPDTNTNVQKDNTVPEANHNLMGNHAFSDGLTSITDAHTEVVGEKNTILPEFIPNSFRVNSFSANTMSVQFCDNNGDISNQAITTTITSARNYITKNYNWNAIVGIMKYVSTEVHGFSYNTPTNLGGNTNDDILIIPDEGIMAIVSVQVQNKINALSGIINPNQITTILNGVDGKPGSSFATSIMGETSQNTLRDEGDNANLTKEDGTAIEIPDFSSASEETLYDFMKDITLARNGLWSDNDEIVNLTGLRRELEISETDDNHVQWNDTMTASWIETDAAGNEIKHCKHYTATTEPGNRDLYRMITPQTFKVLLGLHHQRQPAGRSKDILIEGSDNSNNSLTFQNGSDFNLHPGGMNGLRGRINFPPSNLPAPLSGFPAPGGATTENSFQENLLLVEVFHLLSKYGTSWGNSAYNYLEAERNNALAINAANRTVEQTDAINDYNRVVTILNENVFTTNYDNYIKNTIKFDANAEAQHLDGLNNTAPSITTANLNDNSLEVSEDVSSSSKGCQVIYGGKMFYDYWWNATNKASQSGQRRWYYTLIDITTPYNAIQTQIINANTNQNSNQPANSNTNSTQNSNLEEN